MTGGKERTMNLRGEPLPTVAAETEPAEVASA
jgi:hypothetical protein